MTVLARRNIAGMKLVLALVGVAGAVLSVSWSAVYTGTYAIHLCRWNALLQCDTGTRLFWLVPLTAGAVGILGTYLLFRRTDGGTGPLVGLALVSWVTSLFPVVILLRPRTFGPSELIAAGIWGTVGIILLAVAASLIFPRRRFLAGIGGVALWVGFIATLRVFPSVLEHAWLH